MNSTDIVITLDQHILARLDQLISYHLFPNRSWAIQAAVVETLERFESNRLAQECAKLDPAFEKALAEEGLSEEVTQWNEY